MVPSHHPAALGQPHQLPDPGLRGQIRQPEFRRLGYPARPLRQRPKLLVRLRAPVVPVRRPHPYRQESRAEPPGRALAPEDPLQPFLAQTWREAPAPSPADGPCCAAAASASAPARSMAWPPAAPRPILGPLPRQIQPPGHGQARLPGGHAQADTDLAVFLLSELPAVLPCHADKMPALFRDPGVVDDPGLHGAAPLFWAGPSCAPRPAGPRSTRAPGPPEG